jgi:hypothetical protein
MPSLDRRTFLKCLGVAAGFGLGGLGRGRARADVPQDAVSILVVDFAGAWDVHSSFAARTNPSVNAHGIYTGADTGIIRASNVLFDGRDDQLSLDSAAWGQKIPGFEIAAKNFSLIGAIRHSETFVLDDHVQTSRMGGTGYLDKTDVPGLGTVIGRYAPQGTNAPPAVVIDAGGVTSYMGTAPGPWQPYGPVFLSHSKLPVSGGDVVPWTATEAALDASARGTRRSLAQAKVDLLTRQKQAFHQYRKFFLDPAIDVSNPDKVGAQYTDGILGTASPTTQQLTEAIGGTGYADEQIVALAMRCIEGGSRFVAMGAGLFFPNVYGHDTHSNQSAGDGMYVRDAQVLAGISFLLTKVGLDKKVLLVGLSEMARSPYQGTTYNAGNGTDHGVIGLTTPRGMHGSNRQSILLAHGPIIAGREAYPADPEFGDPIGDNAYSAELLAFLAECAGVARDDHPWSTTPGGAPISADNLTKALCT